eukprot:15438117-Alexandrium_andersonii.AAC.1
MLPSGDGGDGCVAGGEHDRSARPALPWRLVGLHSAASLWRGLAELRSPAGRAVEPLLRGEVGRGGAGLRGR